MENREQLRRRLKMPSITFIGCLFLSVLLWCIINFSKDYTVTLDYKLVCSELPADKSSVTMSDSTLSLTFNTRGLEYLKPCYSDHNRIINISIEEIIMNKPQRSAYTFSNKELHDFLIRTGAFEDELVEVTKPEILTLYLK